MKFTSVLICCYIFQKEILGLSSKNSYHDGLIKYLKEDSKLHQVVFILGDQVRTRDLVMNSLMMSVNSHFPSLSLSSTVVNNLYLPNTHLKLLSRPRSTTLFILHWKNLRTLTYLNQFFDIRNNLLMGSILHIQKVMILINN